MKRKMILIGSVYGRLTVVAENLGGPYHWNCKCECGEYINATYHSLTSGHTRSCGCLYLATRGLSKNKTHGKSRSLTYRKWTDMWTRCTNPKSKGYEYYGARGIAVCDRWKNYLLFEDDMGECPGLQYSLERLNVMEGYHPNNCEWILLKMQATNRRTTIVVGGKCLKHFCIEKGYNYKRVHYRVRKGMSIQEAVKNEPTYING